MREDLGEVRVGLKSVKLKSMTGEIYLTDKKELAIRCPDGKWWTLASLPKFVRFEPGDQASIFWGIVGDVEGDWMAGFNHRTGALGYVPQQLNPLIAPVSVGFYNLLGIVAIFAGLFAVFGLFTGNFGGILVLALVAGFFWWIRRRQGVVKAAVQAAVARIRQRSGATAGLAGA